MPVTVPVGLPAFALTLLRTFQFEARSNWHYEYRARLVGLKRALRDQGASESTVSKRLNDLDLEMQGRFPERNGGSGATPSSLPAA